MLPIISTYDLYHIEHEFYQLISESTAVVRQTSCFDDRKEFRQHMIYIILSDELAHI